MRSSNSDLIYEYILEREPGLRGKTLFIKFRRIMLFRSALLLITMPLETCVLAFRCLVAPWKSPIDAITLTLISPDLLTEFSSRDLVFAGPATWIIEAFRRRGTYMPVSVPYILLTMGLFVPLGFRRTLGKCAKWWISSLCKLYKLRGAKLIIHSDALPFARAFVLCARELGMRTICIQHGIFQAESGIENIDGYLCDVNIVRSHEDREIIAGRNRSTQFVVEPDFFLAIPSIVDIDKSRPIVTLVGEGLHVVDDALALRYISELRRWELELATLSYCVYYRPHPNERSFARKFGFSHLDMTPLHVSIGRTDIYVGYGSTLLIEAAAVGCLAVQIPVDGKYNLGMDRAGIRIQRVTSTGDIMQLASSASARHISMDTLIERKRCAVRRVYQAIS